MGDSVLLRYQELALKGKNGAIAAREFKVALMTNVPDKATAHCDLAEAYLLTGRAADAKKEALAALEIAPTFERAQDLLLKSIGGQPETIRERPR